MSLGIEEAAAAATLANELYISLFGAMSFLHALQNTAAWLMLAGVISIILLYVVGFVGGVVIAALNDGSEEEDL